MNGLEVEHREKHGQEKELETLLEIIIRQIVDKRERRQEEKQQREICQEIQGQGFFIFNPATLDQPLREQAPDEEEKKIDQDRR